MEWVFGLVLIGVIAAAALAFSGKLGTMPAQIDDRPGPDLPAGDLGADDLRNVRFDVVTRGYSPKQVEELLDRLARQLSPETSTEVVESSATASSQALTESISQTAPGVTES